jgi:hypothetical protein
MRHSPRANFAVKQSGLFIALVLWAAAASIALACSTSDDSDNAGQDATNGDATRDEASFDAAPGDASFDADLLSPLFPKMPWSSSGNVYVADVRQDTSDAKVTAWTLEGLINATRAESYVVSRPNDVTQLQAAWGKTPVYVTADGGANPGLNGLFSQFSDRVKVIWIYDNANDWELYLAVMESAQTQGVPVLSSLYPDLKTSNSTWGSIPTRKVSDLLTDAGVTTRAQAYAWAQINLMAKSSNQVLFTMDRRPLLDYAVASGGFIFWLNFNAADSGADEVAEANRIFADSHYTGVGPGHITTLMGYADDNGNDGDQASVSTNPQEIGYVVSDLYANGSFWSSYPDKNYQDAQAAVGTPVDGGAVNGKIYVALNWSDGDNVSFDQGRTYNLWQDASTRSGLGFPVATTLSASLRELNSPLLDWYYANQTQNDELISGPSGIQFIFGDNFKDSGLPDFCKLSGEWLAAAGLHEVYFWNFDNTTSAYASCAALEAVNGIFQQDGPNHPNRPYIVEGGTPAVNSPGTLVATPGKNYLQDLLAGATDGGTDASPVFVAAQCGVQSFGEANGYGTLSDIVDNLNETYPNRFVFLLPRDFFATIRAYYHLPPEGSGGDQ